MLTTMLYRALVLALLLHAPAAQRGFLVTVTWDGTKVSIEKAEAREIAVPLSRGMPSLWPRFFELRNKDGDDGDVYYSGALTNARTLKANPSDAQGAPTYTFVVPDLPDARLLLILERDPKSGASIVARRQL